MLPCLRALTLLLLLDLRIAELRLLVRLCSCGVQILVVMVMLMRIIHVFPALAGLMVTIILVPITTVVSRRLRKVRAALIKCTDDRVKLVTEVITGRPHTYLALSELLRVVYLICKLTPKGAFSALFLL